MSRIIQLRNASRVLAATFGAGAYISAASILRLDPMRLDASLPPTTQQTRRQPQAKIPAQTVRDMSSGSLSGFCAGVVVALFSRTLVFLGTSLVLVIYVASRYGVDMPQILGVKKIINQSSWWIKVQGRPWFTVSFALTFTLAALVRL